MYPGYLGRCHIFYDKNPPPDIIKEDLLKIVEDSYTHYGIIQRVALIDRSSANVCGVGNALSYIPHDYY